MEDSEFTELIKANITTKYQISKENMYNEECLKIEIDEEKKNDFPIKKSKDNKREIWFKPYRSFVIPGANINILIQSQFTY